METVAKSVTSSTYQDGTEPELPKPTADLLLLKDRFLSVLQMYKMKISTLEHELQQEREKNALL